MENRFKEWLERQPRVTEMEVETRAAYTSEGDGAIVGVILLAIGAVMTLVIFTLTLLNN